MRRPAHRRQPHEFEPGRVAPWPAGARPPAEIAGLAQYRGSGEHKTYPSPSGEWILAVRSDKAKCWKFAEADWPRLQELLRKAIAIPCVDEEFRGDFPSRAWFFINDVLHEARLSNELQGWYHAFPLESPDFYPDDPHQLLRSAPRDAIPVL